MLVLQLLLLDVLLFAMLVAKHAAKQIEISIFCNNKQMAKEKRPSEVAGPESAWVGSPGERHCPLNRA